MLLSIQLQIISDTARPSAIESWTTRATRHATNAAS